MVKFITKSPSETKKLAKSLLKEILKNKKSKKAVLIALSGSLGSGKTTFLKGLAEALEIKENVFSPTFLIIKKYKIKSKKFKIKNFFHIDCYRIEDPEQILKLGFKEMISNSQNLIAIEWAQKIKNILPKDIFWLKFKIISKNFRQITFL